MGVTASAGDGKGGIGQKRRWGYLWGSRRPSSGPGTFIWVHVGWTTNCTIGGPPKEDGSQLGQESDIPGVSENEAAGWVGHPHAVLQESAGLILGLFKAWSGQDRKSVV